MYWNFLLDYKDNTEETASANNDDPEVSEEDE